MHSTNTATNNMLNIIMSHYKWDTSVQEYEKTICSVLNKLTVLFVIPNLVYTLLFYS